MFIKKHRLHNRLGKRIENALDLPQGTLSDQPHIEINGRNELIIEGCHGILSYEEDLMELQTGVGMLRINGRQLLIHVLVDGSSKVCGQLLSVEFLS